MPPCARTLRVRAPMGVGPSWGVFSDAGAWRHPLNAPCARTLRVRAPMGVGPSWGLLGRAGMSAGPEDHLLVLHDELVVQEELHRLREHARLEGLAARLHL